MSNLYPQKCTDPELTLEKAKKTIRQRKAVHEQQILLSGADRPSLEAIRSEDTRKRQYGNRRNGKQKNSGS